VRRCNYQNNAALDEGPRREADSRRELRLDPGTILGLLRPMAWDVDDVSRLAGLRELSFGDIRFNQGEPYRRP
jgi:hypothetical protein